MAAEKRLIWAHDAEAKIKSYGKNAIDEGRETLDTVDDIVCLAREIEKIPAVDAVEVVHGRWEWLGPYRGNDEGMIGTCSVCKKRLRLFEKAYCPNCGAKMDGERRPNED